MKRDGRYSVALEYIGQAKPRWVARFCGDWLDWRKSERAAWATCDEHAQHRQTQLTADVEKSEV
jgi:hypothetical protein